MRWSQCYQLILEHRFLPKEISRHHSGYNIKSGVIDCLVTFFFMKKLRETKGQGVSYESKKEVSGRQPARGPQATPSCGPGRSLDQLLTHLHSGPLLACLLLPPLISDGSCCVNLAWVPYTAATRTGFWHPLTISSESDLSCSLFFHFTIPLNSDSLQWPSPATETEMPCRFTCEILK